MKSDGLIEAAALFLNGISKHTTREEHLSHA